MPDPIYWRSLYYFVELMTRGGMANLIGFCSPRGFLEKASVEASARRVLKTVKNWRFSDQLKGTRDSEGARGHHGTQVNWNLAWIPFAAPILLTAALGIYAYRVGGAGKERLGGEGTVGSLRFKESALAGFRFWELRSRAVTQQRYWRNEDTRVQQKQFLRGADIFRRCGAV
jgi:hypothetical protein